MKKTISLFLALLCLMSLFVPAVSAFDTAAVEPNGVVVSSTRFDLPDGGYVIEEITLSENQAVTRSTSTKSGEKNSTRYTADGTAIFGVKVTGTFSYNGSSAWATYSAATVYTYVTNASYVSKSASYSSNYATATGSVKYLGITESRTVTLYCDKNGNLS